MLTKLSRIFAIICAVLHVLLWAYLIIQKTIIQTNADPYSQIINVSEFAAFLILPFLFSVVGLWGSLIFHNKPVSGSSMMLVSGGEGFAIMLIYNRAFIWQNIPSLLLAAAGVLAFISYFISNKKAPGCTSPKTKIRIKQAD